MKKYLTLSLIFSLLFLSSSLYAIDQNSLNQLNQSGYIVIMGELTGAGSKMPLSKLKGFIHPRGIILKEDIQSIIVTKMPTETMVSQVKKIIVHNEELDSQTLEGYFTK